MLLWLSDYLSQYGAGFGVFRYMTLRSVMAALTGLLFCMMFGRPLIRWLASKQIGQVVRSDGPESHRSKEGTPTMGGLMILLGILLAILLWADLSNSYVLILLFCMCSFGALGFYDDWLKIVRKSSKGISARSKFFWQSCFGFFIAVVLYHSASIPGETLYLVPFFKEIMVDLGVGFIFITWFVVVGSSNAVNLTDGLDGLAAMPAAMIAGALGLIAYISGRPDFAEYMLIPHLPGSHEITIIAAAVTGSALGFLWYNAYPAEIFMGDVGSLMLGSLLGCMAVMVRHEIVFAIMAMLFVAEALSVIFQVGSFKLRGKRVFRMAPLHHHYEMKGLAESRIIVRSWVLTIIFILIGLSMLKLR